MTNLSLKKLEELYRSLPGVPCLAGCTGCCVSPTMTLLEFINLMKYVGAEFSKNEIEEIIQKPMVPHPRFEGNFLCRFQSDKGACRVHPGRALACRMHGLPVIDKLGVTNMENCTIMDRAFLPDVPVNRAKTWLDKLMRCNENLMENYGADFYRLIGLNVECWIDILCIDDLSHPLLNALQKLLREHIPVLSLEKEYRPKTDIVEKINSVSLLELIIETGERGSVLRLLDKIEKGYPSTGNYFHSESRWMRQKIPVD